jgi:hypothetical protein
VRQSSWEQGAEGVRDQDEVVGSFGLDLDLDLVQDWAGLGDNDPSALVVLALVDGWRTSNGKVLVRVSDEASVPETEV